MSGHHGHDHSHGAGATRRSLAIAFAITLAVLAAGIVGAIWTGSLALLVDAAHMLTDAGGLLLALTAASLAMRPPSASRTWGYRRAEVIAAAAQATLLLGVGLYALIEGVSRLLDPPEVPSAELLVFGIIGLVGNIAALAVLKSRRGDNLNLRAAYLEVVNDALGSVAVIIAAIVISTTGWARADSVAAILIAVLIIPRTLMLLRESTHVLLEATPKGLDLADVREHMLALPHVLGVHDLHASQIATGLPILTAHVVIEDAAFHNGHAPRVLAQLRSCVAEHFPVSVEHSTFQLEPLEHALAEHGAHD